MDLVIFHHHLLPCGVTTVIMQTIASLRRYGRGISRIRVITGRLPDGGLDIPGAEITCLPETGYALKRSRGGVRWGERADRLAGRLIDGFGAGDVIWWIHNYHLGKNPLFTEAVLRLAYSPSGPRMILQPHDFPEAGRFDSLSELDRLVTLPLYPVGPRIRYAAVNQSDFERLKGAGMPACRLFLLTNPVGLPADETGWRESTRGLRSLLFPWADPRAPIVLYPVRSIRRKNVLEAGILLKLASFPTQLVVTLPGESPREQGYSALVEGAFRDGHIPGEFAAGVRRVDLPVERMAAACDLAVSSSVQEGFGYLFIQALQWGLPLLARSLETIPAGDMIFSGYPAHFYDSLVCPLDAPERSSLLERYCAKLARVRRHLSHDARAALLAEIEGMLSRDCVDFSYFDPPLQLRVLTEAAGSAELRGRLREANRGLTRHLDRLLAERPERRVQDVEKRFGLAAYSALVQRLLDSFHQPVGDEPPADPVRVQEGMRAAFTRAAYQRLLYD
jgi:hypothetical protein